MTSSITIRAPASRNEMEWRVLLSRIYIVIVGMMAISIAVAAVLGFTIFVHIANARFHNEEVGLTGAMDLNAVLIVPFNHSANDFALVKTTTTGVRACICFT